MRKVKRLHITLITAIILSAFVLYGIVTAANPQPGSDDDPIVAKSYVDQEVERLSKKINNLSQQQVKLLETISILEAKINSIDGSSAPQNPPAEVPASSVFKAIQISKGQKLIAGAGTEIVVRSGQATAISGKDGDGLADLTSGGDTSSGMAIKLNHLLVASRDDGRGIKAESDKVYLLVKGEYKLQ